MKLQQAVELIHKLHGENLANSEIAKRLEKAGFKSERTGAPLGEQAIGYHLRNSKPEVSKVVEVSAGPRPTQTVQARRQAKNPTPKKVELVQALLASNDIALKDKCEIAATLLLS